MEKTAGGRPRHGSEVKRAPLNLRTDPDLRARIEASAEERGVSLTQEVERRLRQSFGEEWGTRPDIRDRIVQAATKRGISPTDETMRRLEMSFRDEDAAGGEETRRLLRAIGAVIDAAEGRTGARWFSDDDTFVEMMHSIYEVLIANRPERIESPELQDARKRHAEAQEDRDRVFDQYPVLAAYYEAQSRSIDDSIGSQERSAARESCKQLRTQVPPEAWEAIAAEDKRLRGLEMEIRRLEGFSAASGPLRVVASDAQRHLSHPEQKRA